MLFDHTVYVGIDPTAGNRPMHYAVLDGDLRLVALNQGDMEAVLAFVGGLDSAVVAIDAPQSPNQGRMLNPEVRRRYNLRPGTRTWGQWKECEYELRRRNIRLYNTPSTEKAAPTWVRQGFKLYRRLQGMGYHFFVQGEPTGERTLLEVHPHACFSALLGRRPFLKQTLEGRIQRQLLLYMQGVDLLDPLKALEEITRHHVLTGNLPLEGLYGHDALDAIAGAHTAYLVGAKPNQTTQVGDRAEGFITLPVPALRDFYP